MKVEPLDTGKRNYFIYSRPGFLHVNDTALLVRGALWNWGEMSLIAFLKSFQKSNRLYWTRDRLDRRDPKKFTDPRYRENGLGNTADDVGNTEVKDQSLSYINEDAIPQKNTDGMKQVTGSDAAAKILIPRVMPELIFGVGENFLDI